MTAAPDTADTSAPDTDTGEWVTLREASEAVGVSVSALRKAYRAGRIDSRDEEGPYGPQKLVDLDEVRRVMGPDAKPATGSTPADPRALVLLEEARRGWDAFAALHAAGRELAELRERVGVAETEARLYRERCEELERELAALRAAAPRVIDLDGIDEAALRRGLETLSRHVDLLESLDVDPAPQRSAPVAVPAPAPVERPRGLFGRRR